MKIIDIKIMRGPNVWSIQRQQLIVLQLDLEESENYPTNKIDGFSDRLINIMPSLYEHRCTESKPGGFLEVVRQGTGAAHVIEHIALELQSLAGMRCSFGRTIKTNREGVYTILIEYEVENAGIYAAKAAVEICKKVESDVHYDITKDLSELIRIFRYEGLGVTTQSLVNEARRRNIPFKRLDDDSLIMFGHGRHQKIISTSVACTTSSIGVDIASDKQQTKNILEKNFIPYQPVPPSGVKKASLK